MAGKRKVYVYLSGLAALLALAGMVAWAGLPTDVVDGLAYSVVFLTGTYMGGNVGEHAYSRTRAVPAEPRS